MFNIFKLFWKRDTAIMQPEQEEEHKREMTADEIEFYIHHRMPCCGCADILDTGIRGGLNRIVECPDCGARYNIEPQIFQTIHRLGGNAAENC